jgi:hypothetical protein
MMGKFWMGGRGIDFSLSNDLSIASIKQNLQQYIYGSITLAIIAGITFGLLTLVLLKIFKKKHTQAV